ncbi:hypothetical protein I2W78_12040 [Streptomyces spinoverrucosus]|uniref:hypothetical protein n=1 Tax=Streptomyces spinoverrucosus TaxID=284043 RepID=UPI0018C42045|nr:hypothetical protein [Streptomyces spinoverrucosus]MBG0852548.1 hypothetical protein [Streptomyces spinoverrucosus]
MLTEDRAEYERLLDEALSSAHHRPELAAVGQRLNPEQLRTMALNATALITAAAATEYQHYVGVREELRRPAPVGAPVGQASVSDSAGVGVMAVVAVLGPVLAGAAAAIFLLGGYLLKLFDPDPGIAEHLIVTGWVFGAVTAASILAAVVGLVGSALRNQSSSSEPDELGGEVARAREAWRHALLERGILPFLRAAVEDPAPTSRIPHLGYSEPRFSSPDYSDPEHRPGTSPSP